MERKWAWVDGGEKKKRGRGGGEAGGSKEKEEAVWEKDDIKVWCGEWKGRDGRDTWTDAGISLATRLLPFHLVHPHVSLLPLPTESHLVVALVCS